MHSNRKGLLNYLEVAAFVVLCLIMTYSVFWGVGNPVSIGGLSGWMLLLSLFLLCACLPMVHDLRQILRNSRLWAVVALGVWVLFAAVSGFMKGHPVSVVIRDISGLIYFAFLPFLLAVIRNEKRLHTVMKCMMYAAFAMCFLYTGCFILFLYAPDAFESVKAYFVQIHFLNYTRVSGSIPRLLFVSLPFQLLGCAFSVYFQIRSEKFKPMYACITGLSLFVIVMTFTRALYLAALMAAVCLIVSFAFSVNKANRRKLWIHIAASALVCLMALGVLSLLGGFNYMNYAVRRVVVGLDASIIETTEPVESTEPQDDVPATEPEKKPHGKDTEAENYLQATVDSDALRGIIKEELLTRISQSPVTGNGMGILLEHKKDWPEYSFLDLLAKMGLIGLGLYFLPLALMLLEIIRGIAAGKDILLPAAWVAGMIGLMVYSIFQPYLNNVQCILIYCCTLCSNVGWHTKNDN